MDSKAIEQLVATLPPAEAAEVIKAFLEKQRREIELNAQIGNGGPYYNKITAEEVRPFIDRMIETREEIELNYEDYPNHSPHTIALRLRNGVRYLVESDAVNGKYRLWRPKVKVKRYPSGCGVFWLKGQDNPESLDGKLRPHFIKPGVDRTEQSAPSDLPYMQVLTEFIENAVEGQHTKISGLNLTQNEIIQIHNLFESIKDEFELKVSPNRIIVMKGRLPNDDPNN